MTKWDEAVFEYQRTGNVKKCPYCNSDSVDLKEYKGTRRHCIFIKCENCKREAHYDGIINS